MTNATCTDCGHPTDSQALDLCRSCEDRVQLVCAGTSDLPEIKPVYTPFSNPEPVYIQVDRKVYMALCTLYWTARLLYWTKDAAHSGYEPCVKSLPCDVQNVTDALEAQRQRDKTARREFRDVQETKPNTRANHESL